MNNVCLSCGCSNGYKFNDNKKVEYYNYIILGSIV